MKPGDILILIHKENGKRPYEKNSMTWTNNSVEEDVQESSALKLQVQKMQMGILK